MGPQAHLSLLRDALADRYAVERLLGAGGMAEVYAARDVRHDRMVAIKVMRGDLWAARGDERFEREVRIAARLQHPNIVPLYDSGIAAGLRYFVMPLVDGPSLRNRLDREQRLPLEEAVRIAAEVADALDYAHAQGIVHRDIKPENILLSSGRPLVADFGIARPTAEETGSPTLTEGFALGTPAYMSPEQAAGERAVDGRADQYALGCVVYEMLTGRAPFAADTPQAVIVRHFVDPVPPLRLPPPAPAGALDDVLGRALAKEPAARFATTGEFATALRAASRRSADSDPHAAAIGGSARGNLPSPTEPLVGREQAIDDALALLRRPDVRLVTFTGPGGTGKTRLALEVGTRLRGELEHGVWFVSLAAVADAVSVPTTMALALGVRDVSGMSVAEALAALLGGRRALLILDDFERHVAAAPWVTELLAAAPALTVLVTSRVLLHLRSEHEFPVPPLEVPDLARPPGRRDLAGYASVQLFARRARAVDPSFALTEENTPAVAEICARVDGLPLAIELAAARAKLLPPRSIVARLGSRLRLLTGGARDLPERHRTIRQAIAWSYDLLAEPERRLFARLAVFAGGCTLETAEAVCDADGALGIDVLDGVAALVGASLVTRDVRRERDGDPRFTMLDTIREFALEQFEHDPGVETLRDAHRDWFLDLARRAAPKLAGAQQDAWLATLAAEHANLRAAMDRSVELGDAETALAFGASLWRYWVVRGHFLEGQEWLDRLLAMPAGDRLAALRADVLTGAAKLAHNLSDLERAATHTAAALKLRRQLGDRPGVAQTLADLGWIAWRRCEFAEARRLSNESLALAEEIGDRRGMAQALSNLGWVALYEGDLAGARKAFERGLALRTELGDRRNVAFMRLMLAWTAGRTGDPERQLPVYEDVLATFRAVGDDVLYAFALSLVAEAALRKGDARRAQSVLESESIPLLRQRGDLWGLAHTANLLSAVARAQGDLDRAELIARENLERFRSIHNPYGVGQSLAALGEVARARGDEAGARRFYEESLAIRRAVGDRLGVEESERALAAPAGGDA